MTSDTERREVARRLREVQADIIHGTKTEAHPIAGRIIGVACGYDLPDFQGLLSRLADLIDPSEPKVKCVAEVKVNGERLEKLVHDAAVELTAIDRDALLELADEMTVEKGDVWRWSSRIRKALGIPDERTTDATTC